MHTDDNGKSNKVNSRSKKKNNVQNNEIGNDFSDFYNVSNSYEENNEEETEKGGKNIKIIIIIIILAIVLGVLIFVLIKLLNKKDMTPPSISLSSPISSGDWTNNDVTIEVKNPSNATIKYTINCDKDCDYVDVTDNKILISNPGTNKVSVIATGENGVETKEDITISIDKEVPTAILSTDNKYSGSSTLKICAVCADSESGCREETVCNTYNSSMSKQKITVYDKAGNVASTNAFDVKISSGGSGNNSNNKTPSCSLSVSSKGVITASVKNATYYGFSSSYSGSNGTSKTLSKTKDGEEKITYYVKNSSSGKTSTCSITVKYSNCGCLYRGDDGKCYKTFVKQITDPKSSECAKATRKTNRGCDFYKDEGISCTYTKK